MSTDALLALALVLVLVIVYISWRSNTFSRGDTFWGAMAHDNSMRKCNVGTDSPPYYGVHNCNYV